MEIICKSCSKTNKIPNPERFRGAGDIMFRCKNNECKTKLKFNIPTVEDKKEPNGTLILPEGNKVISACMEYTNRSGEIDRCKIGMGINFLGRNSASIEIEMPLHIADKSVSRKHAVVIGKVVNDNFKCIIRDYNSRNRTYINGNLLHEDEEIYLMSGDKLQLGNTSLTYLEQQ